MVTSVNSNSNSPLQQANQASQQKPSPAELARQREAEDAKRRQAQQAANTANKPNPTVNAHGQTTGSIINTTA